MPAGREKLKDRREMCAEVARDIYTYDGCDLRYSRTRSNQVGGTVVGAVSIQGYRQCGYLGKQYKVHRLVWMYVYGDWPKGIIDHINGDPLDNRIENLRDTCGSVNTLNQKTSRGNSKYTGVHKRNGRFEVALQWKGNRGYIGSFDTEEEAFAARVAAEVEICGQQISNIR